MVNLWSWKKNKFSSFFSYEQKRWRIDKSNNYFDNSILLVSHTRPGESNDLFYLIVCFCDEDSKVKIFLLGV